MSRMRALAPRMIGRQAQLSELEEQLRQVRAGAGRVVLVAGEAGVGKTRLLRAFREHAHAQAGVEVLQGSCYEEQPPAAYGPFLDALRTWVRARGAAPVMEAAGPLAGDLLPLLPELALPAASPVGPGDDPQARKQRLFEALYRALRPSAAGGARVLVLEDLHWADQTSLELLRYLARAAEHEPLLLLGTYRADEVDPRHPLHHALAQLARGHLLQEITLPPLPRVDLARMLAETLGRAVPDPFLAAMEERTGGNPFFAEEILSSLLDEGRLDEALHAAGGGIQAAIPRSVADSIHGRLAGLDEATIDVLRYAAVIGRHFDFDLLLRLTGLEEDALLRAVARLVERQIVAEERGSREDRYSFRHALSREAVYGELLGRDRRRKHRSVLEALEALHGVGADAVLDQLAYHSLQAGERARAAHYARLAGDRGARQSAFREALGHYQTALDLQETEDPRERAALLERLADVAYPLGDSGVYGRCWQEAQRLYLALGDHRQAALLSLHLGGYYADGGDNEAALATTAAARDVLEAEPPGRELAMAYAEMARRYWNMERPRESIEWGEKALRLAEELGDGEVQARALIYIGESLPYLGEPWRGVEYLERSREVARRAGAVKEVLSAYFHLGHILVADLGELRRAVRMYREALSVARQHGWEVRMNGDIGQGLGFAEMALGEWEQAHQTLDRAIAAGELGHPWGGLEATELKGELLLRQGRPEEARRLLEGILPTYESMQDWISLMGPILARVRLALGDGEGALAAMEQWVERWRKAGSPARWEVALAWGVEVYLGAGRQERARELLRDLSASAERSPTPMTRAVLADALGLVAAHEGRRGEAAGHFGQAAALWHAMEASYLEARARRLGAESLLQSGEPGNREEAIAELAAAQAICTALGAPLELAAIAALAARYRLAPIRRAGASSGPRPAQPLPTAGQIDGLTRREREVIALVARGASNRAIAEALVIAERTAENHVANILGKLGLASRAQAAAYAVAHGLASPTAR